MGEVGGVVMFSGLCVHLIFSGGQGGALAQNTIKVRYITIWYSAGVLTLCETTGVPAV